MCRLVLNPVAQLAVQRDWGCPFAGAAESQDNVHWNCSEPAPRVIQTWVSMLCYRTRYNYKDTSRLVSMRTDKIRNSSCSHPCRAAAYLNNAMMTERRWSPQMEASRRRPHIAAVPRLNVTRFAMPKPLAAIVCFAMSWCVLTAQTHADSPTIDDNATVAEIVETLIKRHGGKSASDHWKCGTIEFTTTAGILPPGMETATVTESFAFPNFFKRSIVADSPDGEIDLTFIINKDGGWMTSPGKPTMEIPRAFADRERHTFADICAVAHLRDNIENLTIVKKLDIDSKPAIQLRLESEGLGTGDFFVDLHPGLLVGTSKQTLDPTTGIQAIISTRLGKYKDFKGIAVPMAFTATSDGKKMLDVTIAKLEFKDSLPDSTFAKPE